MERHQPQVNLKAWWPLKSFLSKVIFISSSFCLKLVDPEIQVSWMYTVNKDSALSPGECSPSDVRRNVHVVVLGPHRLQRSEGFPTELWCAHSWRMQWLLLRGESLDYLPTLVENGVTSSHSLYKQETALPKLKTGYPAVASHCTWDIKTWLLRMVCRPWGSSSCPPFSLCDTILTRTLGPQPPRLGLFISQSCQALWDPRTWSQSFPYTLKRALPTDFTELIPMLPSAPGSRSQRTPSCTNPSPLSCSLFPQKLLSFLHSTHISFKLSILLFRWCWGNCMTECPSPPPDSKLPHVALKRHSGSWPTRLDLAAQTY